jgi:hypothetical protein
MGDAGAVTGLQAKLEQEARDRCGCGTCRWEPERRHELCDFIPFMREYAYITRVALEHLGLHSAASGLHADFDRPVAHG